MKFEQAQISRKPPQVGGQTRYKRAQAKNLRSRFIRAYYPSQTNSFCSFLDLDLLNEDKLEKIREYVKQHRIQSGKDDIVYLTNR